MKRALLRFLSWPAILFLINEIQKAQVAYILKTQLDQKILSKILHDRTDRTSYYFIAGILVPKSGRYRMITAPWIIGDTSNDHMRLESRQVFLRIIDFFLSNRIRNSS